MYRGDIFFDVVNDLAEMDNFEIDVGCEELCSVSVAASGSKINIRCFVFIKSLYVIDGILSLCKDFAESVLDRICCYFDKSVGPLEYVGYKLRDDDGKLIEFKPKRMIIRIVHGGYAVPKGILEEQFSLCVYDYSTRRNFYYKQYRYIMGIDDNFQKFMLLYNIMMQICGDRQIGVDDLIKKIDPEVPLSGCMLRGKPREETIFTKLRNEIAHSRRPGELKSICGSIANNVFYFQDIVKKAIASVA